LGKFIEAGILGLKDGIIWFLGDDFDRIYCKYFAHSRKITLFVSDLDPEEYCAQRLATVWGRDGRLISLRVAETLSDSTSSFDVQWLTGKSLWREKLPDAFKLWPPQLSAKVYYILLYQSQETKPVLGFVSFVVTTPWMRLVAPFCTQDAKAIQRMPILETEFKGMAKRAEELGGTLQYEIRRTDGPFPSVQDLSRAVLESGNLELRRALS
jgi:hypothetical protein